ncbi:hypothetical protein D3C85_1602830 [compost metagenome]
MEPFVEQQPVRNAKTRKFRNVLIVIGLLLVLLAVLNPGRDDFTDYAVNNLDDTLGRGFPDGISDLVARPLLNSFAERDNFILFSVFSIPDIQDSSTFIEDITEDKKYLGLFKRFFFEL